MENGVISADELRHVTTSLIEKEVEGMILETDVHEVTYPMNSLQEKIKKLEEQTRGVSAVIV